MGTTNPATVITQEERTLLEGWVLGDGVDGGVLAKRRLRASIVLGFADGLDSSEVASRVGVRVDTVEKWRLRFLRDRVSGLLDRPRVGAPRRISDEQIEQVVRCAAEPTPPFAKPWSRRTLASATGLSRSTIDRIWRRFDVNPGRPGSSA